MARYSSLAIAAAILAACFAAAWRQHNSTSGTSGGWQTPASGDSQRIDQTVVEPLPPVRAPAGLGERALEHVRMLTSFGPRHSGTPGWTRQLDYIERSLQQHGLVSHRDTWTDRKELLTFTNLRTVIQGSRPERIVLGAHHDTKCTTGHADPTHNFHFVGANDGGSGVALLLELAPVLRAAQLPATIELVFFDGEESLDWAWNDAARALFGSRRYVKQYRDNLIIAPEETPPIVAMILLDLVGRKDLHLQEELFSTPRLRTLLWSAAVALGYQQHVFRRAEAASDDHLPFLDVGIPAVDLIDLTGNPYWHTAEDTVENMSAESMQITADLVLTMLPAVLKEYLPRQD